jgi:sugar lactone lactonase YvrE
VLIELSERHAPDGMSVGADGKLYVASTFFHAVSVVEGGQIVDRLTCGDGMPTNHCFGGTDVYVTESRRGTIRRSPLADRPVSPLLTGRRPPVS